MLRYELAVELRVIYENDDKICCTQLLGREFDSLIGSRQGREVNNVRIADADGGPALGESLGDSNARALAPITCSSLIGEA